MSASNLVEMLSVIDSLDGGDPSDSIALDQTVTKKNEEILTPVPKQASDCAHDLETTVVKRFLCPSSQKLYDFRKEPGFDDIATKTLTEKRTLLEHNRLLTLFQAIRNTRNLGQSVAEIGSYRGGSAKFIARTLVHFGVESRVHIFDTFSGHPQHLIETLDGEHVSGLFSDTDAESVRSYLSDFDNIEMHVGTIEERCSEVADERFALVHIDVDIYSATVTCLNFFSPRLVSGGIFVIDDYGFSTCIGVKQAVDYFLTVNSEYTGWYLHTGQYVLQKTNTGIATSRPNDDMQELLQHNALTARLMEQQQIIQGLQAQLVASSVTASLEKSRKDSFKQLAEKLSKQIVSKQEKLDEFSKFRKAVERRPWLNWLVGKSVSKSEL